jgi:hypothetical protein
VALVKRLAQSVPQSVGALAGQTFVHAYEAPVGAQLGVSPLHLLWQPPQLEGFEKSASQPSLGSRLQSPNPSAHDSIAHAPLAHVAIAFATTHGLQDFAAQPWLGSSTPKHSPLQLF